MKVKKLVQSICASILHKVRQIQSIRDLWLCTYDNTVQADMIQNSKRIRDFITFRLWIL
jgi:hypothetical protein